MAKNNEPEEEALELEGFVENPSQEEQGLVIQLAVETRGTINDNLEKAEVEIIKKVRDAIEQAKSGDLVKAKKVVSFANNQIKDLNQKRISVKNEWMKPLDDIASKIKEIERKIGDELKPLTDEISIQEEKELDEKIKLIKKLKDSRIDKESLAISIFIRGCKWFDNPSWTNKGYTEPKITKEIDAKVLEIVGNLEALDLIGEGNRNSSAISLKYQESGNLSQAIAYRKQLEEADRQEEERKAKKKEEEQDRIAKEQQEKEARDERLGIQEESASGDENTKDGNEMQGKTMASGTSPEPVTHDYTLTIRCQPEFLRSLGEFMRNNGCKYKLEGK
ncbi:MAG: DUF1351 domain-containing protein [Candidatus Methanomethylophilaceae archaeon]|jgi:hypothetical protein